MQPSDIAVLVRSNDDAVKIRDALRLRGIPAMLARGGSVLESPGADQWRWLLDAMSRPSDPVRARTFALSWFGGRSADWVATAGDDDLVELQEQLAEWVAVLAERGVTDFQRRLWADTGVVARVLARPDGDRELTDLEHVAELLGTGAGDQHQSVAGLLSILDAPPPEEIDADVDRDQAARRVESEALAVHVMTVWVAKGLEFPIVCVPTMWSSGNATPIVPDPDGPIGARMYDLASKPWPDAAATKERKALAEAETLGEHLRLLYVALTRARHQTIVWWTSVSTAKKSGLTRVLFARDAEGRLDPEQFSAATCATAGPRAGGRAARAGRRGLARHDLAHGARPPAPHRRPLDACRARPLTTTRSNWRASPAVRTARGAGGRSPRSARATSTATTIPPMRPARTPARPTSPPTPTSPATSCRPMPTRARSPPCRPAPRSGPWSTRCWNWSTSPRTRWPTTCVPRSSASCPTGPSTSHHVGPTAPGAPPRRGSTCSSRGCRTPSRHRWAHCWATAACATCRAPTGSTRWTSTCASAMPSSPRATPSSVP